MSDTTSSYGDPVVEPEARPTMTSSERAERRDSRMPKQPGRDAVERGSAPAPRMISGCTVDAAPPPPDEPRCGPDHGPPTTKPTFGRDSTETEVVAPVVVAADPSPKPTVPAAAAVPVVGRCRAALPSAAPDLRPGARGAPPRGNRAPPARSVWSPPSPSRCSIWGRRSAFGPCGRHHRRATSAKCSRALRTSCCGSPSSSSSSVLASGRVHQSRPVGLLGGLRPLVGVISPTAGTSSGCSSRRRSGCSPRSEGDELIKDQLYAPLAIAAFIIGRELTIWFGAWAAARGKRVHRAQHRGAARVRAHARGGSAALSSVGDRERRELRADPSARSSRSVSRSQRSSRS